MKKIDKIKKLLRIIMIVLVIVIGIYAFKTVAPSIKKESNNDIDKVKEYVLYRRDSELYKGIFNKLKEELNKESIDYNKYAEYISELFIIDLYTLSNKNSSEDVGGIGYVLDSVKDNYKLNVSNTLYKYINSIDEKPTVSSIELISKKDTTYKLNNKIYDGYEISLKWDYTKDLGYEKEGIVIVIKDNDKLFVVEKK